MSKSTKYLVIGVAVGIGVHVLYQNMNKDVKR